MNKIITFLTNKAFGIMLVILILVAVCVLFPTFLAKVYNFIQTTPFFSKNLFNFLVVLGFFAWLLVKFDFLGILDKKKDEIISTIRNAENRKKQSVKELQNTTNALKNIDKDIEQIVNEAKNIAKNIEQKSQEKLKQGYESKAKIEVSQKIANASVAIAKQYIENSLDENMHKELIYNFINNLENMRVE